ncbi:hypothetical protein ACOSQ3_009105 [Xanthoceras sorbifolium]
MKFPNNGETTQPTIRVVPKHTTSCYSVQTIDLLPINIQLGPSRKRRGPSNEIQIHFFLFKTDAVSLHPVFLVVQNNPSWVVGYGEIFIKNSLTAPIFPKEPDNKHKIKIPRYAVLLQISGFQNPKEPVLYILLLLLICID